MRTVVFAYHTMGCSGIEALIRHGFAIAAVFTHRDTPGDVTWFESFTGHDGDRGGRLTADADAHGPAVASTSLDTDVPPGGEELAELPDGVVESAPARLRNGRTTHGSRISHLPRTLFCLR